MANETANASSEWISNQTLYNDSTEYISGDFVRTLGISIGIFDILLGSVGNFLTIVAILGNRRLRNTFHSFIVSLCFVDFCTATFMMPFNVTSYATGTWPFGEEHITCAVQAYMYYCCGYSSVVCLLVITVNRFIGVVYPDKYEEIFSPAITYTTIAISWLFAPVVMSVFFFLGNDGNPGYGWIDKYSLCVFRTDEDNLVLRRYMVFTRVLFQCLPLVIMIILYSIIFYTARKSGRSVAKMSLKSAESMSGPAMPSTRKYPVEDQAASPKLLHREARSDVDLAKSKYKIDAPTDKERGYHSDGSNVSLDTLGIQTPSLNTVGRISHDAMEETKLLDPDFKKALLVAYLPKNSPKVSSPTHKALPKTMSTNSHSHTKGLISSLKNSVQRKTPSCRGSMADTIRKRRRMDRKLLSISLAICLVFSIIFYPSVLINLFPQSRNFSPNVHKCASIITWLNSCVNPVIYCFMNPKLRAEYKYLLQKFAYWILKLLGRKTPVTSNGRWERSISSFR